MHEMGMWTVQDGDIIFKSKSRQVTKVNHPAMIVDMLAGTLHKFGEKDWVLSHHRHLASTYGEDMFALIEFPADWSNDDIITVANFACNAHDADKIILLFSEHTPSNLIEECLSELRAKGF